MSSLVPGIESAPPSTKIESQWEEGGPLGDQRMLGRQNEAPALVAPVGCAGWTPPEHQDPFSTSTVFLLFCFAFSCLHRLEHPTQYWIEVGRVGLAAPFLI